MDTPLTCKYCAQECFVIYKELSLHGQTETAVCEKCSKLFEMKDKKANVDQALKMVTCFTCHSSITSICEGKALGCYNCYETFQPYITELLLKSIYVPDKLKQILNQDTKFQLHIGRTPYMSSIPDLAAQIEELELFLETALKTENFELAASYRDQLTQLKLSQNKPPL